MYIRAAGPLTVTILSIAICNIFHLNRAPYNIRVVGTVPAVRRFSGARLCCRPECPLRVFSFEPIPLFCCTQLPPPAYHGQTRMQGHALSAV